MTEYGEYGTVTQVRKKHVSWRSATPHPRSWTPASSKFLGPPILAHCMINNNKILHGNRIRCEEIFTGSTTNADARFVCGS